jgi:hypothetical protein
MSSSARVTFVDRAEEADLVLVVDMDEGGLFANLRHNPVWRRWPEKSFGMYEGDEPPRFLHGLYSSARKAWSRRGRYLSCAYPVLRACFPSAAPPLAEVRASRKDLLFSFAGRTSYRLRRRLHHIPFPKDEVVIQDTSTYNHFDAGAKDREAAQKRYWQLAARSKFVLCPRGAGTSSIRLFEMMEAGIAPVVISDDWVRPLGPRWEDFALSVPERKIARLYDIVKHCEGEFCERGLKARQAYEEFFAPDRYWEFVLSSIEHIRHAQRMPEAVFSKALPLLVAHEWARHRAIRVSMFVRGLARACLKSFRKKRGVSE